MTLMQKKGVHLTIAVFGSLSVLSPSWARKAPKPDHVWAIIKPMQCLSNPWEQDWVARHRKAEAYPQREEKQIVTDFFAKNGVKIQDVRTKPYQGGPLCTTCDCPRGDTLFLLVTPEDAAQLKPFGFTKTLPAKN